MKLKNNFSRLILVTAIFSISITASAQTPIKNVVANANDMAAKLIAKDYVSFINYMHPKLIEASGGKKALVNLLRQTYTSLSEKGTEFSKAILNEPQAILKVGTEMQTTILQKSVVKSPNGDFYIESTLIAVSKNKGLNWVFIDCSKITLAQIRQLIPTLSSKLIVTAPSKPVKM